MRSVSTIGWVLFAPCAVSVAVGDAPAVPICDHALMYSTTALDDWDGSPYPRPLRKRGTLSNLLGNAGISSAGFLPATAPALTSLFIYPTALQGFIHTQSKRVAGLHRVLVAPKQSPPRGGLSA